MSAGSKLYGCYRGRIPLTEQDQVATLDTLNTPRRTMDRPMSELGLRIANTASGSGLVEGPTAADTARRAGHMQDALASTRQYDPEDVRFQLSIGDACRGRGEDRRAYATEAPSSHPVR
ncbi:hypothetical protein SAMN02927923_03217 [Microvirga guangxiensis]|uniref:Uncharacterized protein n=1 Tax=Microvirga guangxiensis TaxID=549386 RepID=A0A1G5KCJ7_9HYPH|nr:hypothetical protein SAMN02927923_03217 [Microvirga guangxiensis]